jgi:dihydrodipicolinate reductase
MSSVPSSSSSSSATQHENEFVVTTLSDVKQATSQLAKLCRDTGMLICLCMSLCVRMCVKFLLSDSMSSVICHLSPVICRLSCVSCMCGCCS